LTIHRGDPKVYEVLKSLDISFEYHEHPPVPTVREAAIYWKDLNATHCKNLFFRNHKGDKHYLVIFEYSHNIQIKDLEQRLKQGKLTFASDQRLMKYLGLTPGSVSPFGLINDHTKHVHLFLDENFKKSEKISFHPNLNTASLILSYRDFERYLSSSGNLFEFVKLYDEIP
jgi:Ala-tRNA(Pro) deacylase